MHSLSSKHRREGIHPCEDKWQAAWVNMLNQTKVQKGHLHSCLPDVLKEPRLKRKEMAPSDWLRGH